MADLDDLTVRMRAFSEARDWGRFHDLKSLTLALTGEVGEVAELVQWLPAGTTSADDTCVPDWPTSSRTCCSTSFAWPTSPASS